MPIRTGTRARLQAYTALASPTPEQRRCRLNKAIQAITEDDVRTLVSCIPGHIEVKEVFDLLIGGCDGETGEGRYSDGGRRVRASLLHLAVHHKAPQCTKLLLHLGAPTEANESLLGDCAIHSALRIGGGGGGGIYSLVTLLLEYGASPTSLNSAQDTPLHLAAERGLVHVVKLLLDAGALTTARNRYEETPWDLATLSGSPSSQACADLILTHHLQQQ
ncbi:hypothetical protein Pcinc_022091 [Petrolisthes cinctipes]|uniref:Uncharacterized protein n=1 Tax=Petrolisthes cinctipes TaxID=88211 RepID=A0AAE1FFF3_PETCI|nr:hypothetical protein Pcinc_022091 [Petrolisthes cinctipes]